MEILLFCLGFLISHIISLVMRAKTTYTDYKLLEVQHLYSAVNLVQYKYHAIKILELAYEEAAETNPSKTEECKMVVAKIHEKFDSFGDSYIQELINKLPYKTQYNDWASAIVYAEQLITNSKVKK